MYIYIGLYRKRGSYPKWMVYNGNFRRGTPILGNPHPSIHPSIYIYIFYVYIYIIIFWPQDINIYIYITHHPDYIYIYMWYAYAVIRQIDTSKTRHNSKIFSWGKSHSSRPYATKQIPPLLYNIGINNYRIWMINTKYGYTFSFVIFF